MNFQTILHYNEQEKKRTILDYHLQVKELKKEDLQWYWEGTNRNYSLAGFEMKLKRHTTKYIVEYYLPSGLFVITSWVCYSITFINRKPLSFYYHNHCHCHNLGY